MDVSNRPLAVTNYKREIAIILFKHFRLIAWTTVTVFTLAVLITLFWPATYGAYTSLLVKSHRIDRDPTVLEASELRPAPVTDNDTYSEMSILTSDEVLGRTLRALEQAGRSDALMALSETPDKRMRKLRDAITAKVIPTTALIEVTLAGSDDKLTLQILRTMLDNYMTLRQSVFMPGSAVTALADKVRSVKADIEHRTQAMADFLARNNLSNADGQITSNLQIRASLETSLVTLERNIADLQAEISYFSELLSSRDTQMLSAAHLAGNITLTGRAEIASYQRQDQEKLASAEQARRDTLVRLAAIDDQNQKLRRSQLTYDTMVQELQVLQKAYQSLLTLHGEADMAHRPSADGPNPYVSFVASPQLLDEPIFPKARIVLPVGLVAAVLLGLGLAFVKESLDHTFTRPEEVEQQLGVPVLFSIPDGGIRSRTWRKTAMLTASGGSAVPPRARWLRRGMQLALVVVTLWAVGAMVRSEWAGSLISYAPKDTALAPVDLPVPEQSVGIPPEPRP